MRYAQFFSLSTGYVENSIPPEFREENKRPIEACGSNGVIIIDARIRLIDAGRIASAECTKRGFIGWEIREGRSFSDSRPVGGFNFAKTHASAIRTVNPFPKFK